MLGVLANSGAVLVGGVIGLVFRGKIKEKYTSSLMAALALVSLGLGIICVVGTSDTLCLILCTAVGTLIGELLRIDDRVEALGALAEKSSPSPKVDSPRPLSPVPSYSASAPWPSWAAWRPA